MNINAILTEWQYRLPKGYPTEPSDYKVLTEILVEKGMDPDAADRIAQQARGDVSQPEDEYSIIKQIKSMSSGVRVKDVSWQKRFEYAGQAVSAIAAMGLGSGGIYQGPG